MQAVPSQPPPVQGGVLTWAKTHRQTHQETQLQDAMLFLVECSEHRVELVVDGSWHYIDKAQKMGYVARWDEFQGVEVLRVQFNDFKGGTQGFSGWDTIAELHQSYTYCKQRPKRALVKALQPQPRGRKTDDEKRKQEHITKALKTFFTLPEHGHSGYLEGKGITGLGVRYHQNYHGHHIQVLLQDVGGNAKGIQEIYDTPLPDGKGNKKFTWGTDIKGSFAVVGDLSTDAEQVYICEGYATAVTVHLATNAPVAAAMNANNLAPVVKALIEADYSPRKLCIASDNDFQKATHKNTQGENIGNTGLLAAQKAAQIYQIAYKVPRFQAFEVGDKKVSDFNDLCQLSDLDEVEIQLTLSGFKNYARALDREAEKGDGKEAKKGENNPKNKAEKKAPGEASYLDYRHLLDSPDCDGVNRTLINFEGLPILDDKTLVKKRQEVKEKKALFLEKERQFLKEKDPEKKEVLKVGLVEAKEASKKAIEKYRRWASTVHDHKAAQYVRAYLQTLGVHYQKDFETGAFCKDDWYLQRQALEAEEGVNSEYDDREEVLPQHRYRMLAFSCRERDVCPSCAIAYGREQGAELFSFLEAAIGRLKEPLPKGGTMAWGIVFTLHPLLNSYLEKLIRSDDPKDLKLFRKALKDLQEAQHQAISKAFGFSPEEIGIASNWHYWHSYDPRKPDNIFRGISFHCHTLVPNVTAKTRGCLNFEGKLGEKKLTKFRDEWKCWLIKYFPFLEGDFEQEPNIHIRYFTNSRDGRRKLRHRCRYDARSMFADVVNTWNDPNSAFTLATGEDLEAKEQDLLYLVGIGKKLTGRTKLRRYKGFASPGKRKEVGLRPVKEEKEAVQWEFVEGGYRKVVEFTYVGAIFSGWDAEGIFYQHIQRELICWEATAPPTEWEYKPEYDKVAKK